jgi:hypothetical protein
MPTTVPEPFERLPMTHVGADGRRVVGVDPAQVRARGDYNLAAYRARLAQSNPAAIAQEERAFLQTLERTRTITVPHTPTGRYVEDGALNQLSRMTALAREAGFEVDGAIVIRNNALEVGVRRPVVVEPAPVPVAEPVAVPPVAEPVVAPAPPTASGPPTAARAAPVAGRSRASVAGGATASRRAAAMDPLVGAAPRSRASATGDVIVRTPRESARVGTPATGTGRIADLEQRYATAWRDYGDLGGVRSEPRKIVERRITQPDRFKVTNPRQNAVVNEFLRDEGIRPEALSNVDVDGVATRFTRWIARRESMGKYW